MLKLKFVFLFLLCCSARLSYAQFAVTNTMPCDTERVRVYLPPFTDPMFTSMLCADDPENPIYDGNQYYMFDVTFPPDAGSITVLSGQENQISTNTTLVFRATANSYLYPPHFTVHIIGYKRRLIGGSYDVCFTQDIFVSPMKRVTLSGATNVEIEGPHTYTVTDIPGVTWTWSVPQGWTTISSTTNTITVIPGPGVAGSQTISATPSQFLANSCGLPASLNVAVSSCAFSGVSDYDFCNPETNWTTSFRSFEYGNPTSEGNGNKFPRMMGDFNGDGKDDLIGFGNTAVAVGLSTGSSFYVNTWFNDFTYGNGGYTQDKYPRHIGDFNGDGKDDILCFGPLFTMPALSTGSSFSIAGFTPTSHLSYAEGFTGNHLPRKVGDFNGDGKDDIIGFGHHSVTVGLSTGNSFNVSSWGTVFNSTDFSDENKWPRMLGDFNGDGKTDVIGFGNSSVTVGISTGSGFNTSTWTTEFTYGTSGGMSQHNRPRAIGDFNGDGKDDIIVSGDHRIWVALSNGSSFDYAGEWQFAGGYADSYWNPADFSSLTTRPNLLIADVNADGKDDLVGFTEEGTFVSFSTGSRFECPAKTEMLSLASQYHSKDARFVGNFDNTDDMLELVALDHDVVQVMNCKTCTSSVANVNVNGHYAMSKESGYQGWKLDVYKFCSNDLRLDVSQTLCEDRYFVTVREFDINTWTFQSTVYESGWIVQNAPNTIDLSSLNLVPGKLYWVDFGVGPTWNVKSFGVRITDPVAGFTLSPKQTRTMTSLGIPFVINGYCSNTVSAGANGSSSVCAEEYRYEISEVFPPFMIPSATPLQQIPAGGGWNPGPLTTNSFDVTGMVSGKLYVIRLYIRSNGITSTSQHFMEKIGPCTINPGGGGSAGIQLADEGESQLYPNPALNQISVNITDYGVPVVSGSIYDSHGRCVRNLELNGNSHNTVDINSLAPGMYFITLQANGKSEKISFVKQ